MLSRGPLLRTVIVSGCHLGGTDDGSCCAAVRGQVGFKVSYRGMQSGLQRYKHCSPRKGKL